MTLDDVYGSDLDQFPFELETDGRDTDFPQLEWDESEVSILVDGIIGRHRAAD